VSIVNPTTAKKCLAESVGTYLLVFFGYGVVRSAVLTGSQSGLWQVAVVWGLATMLAIYVVGPISGAHINPAITLAFAAKGRFPWRLVLPYVAAQLVGAFVAAGTLFFHFLSLAGNQGSRKRCCAWAARQRGDRDVLRGVLSQSRRRGDGEWSLFPRGWPKAQLNGQ